jgi:hypothetical protein
MINPRAIPRALWVALVSAGLDAYTLGVCASSLALAACLMVMTEAGLVRPDVAALVAYREERWLAREADAVDRELEEALR